MNGQTHRGLVEQCPLTSGQSGNVADVCMYYCAYIHLRFQHAVMDTPLSCLSRTVRVSSLLIFKVQAHCPGHTP